PITLCDDRGVDFVTVAGHIPMAVHNLAWRARKRYCYGRTARARIAAWAMRAAVTSSLSEPADTGEGTGNGYRSVAARGGAACCAALKMPMKAAFTMPVENRAIRAAWWAR